MTLKPKPMAASLMLGIDHILAAAGLSSKMTLWGLYQAIQAPAAHAPASASADDFDPHSVIERGLLIHLIETHGVMYHDNPTAMFSDPFECGPTITIQHAGSSCLIANGLLMIETPTRWTYGHDYTVGQDIILPAEIVAKANIKMAATDTKDAIVWVFGDAGSIDSMHVVHRDDRLIAELQKACENILNRVATGDEPEIVDKDMNRFLAAQTLNGSTVRKYSKDSHEGAALTRFLTHTAELEDLRLKVKSFETAIQSDKTVLLTALRNATALQIGHHFVRRETIAVPDKMKKGYTFQKLAISDE